MTKVNSFDSETATTTTGHHLSSSEWLDTHFLAMQPEYEAMLDSVGLQKDWHILDAACGNGSFLPLMTELVGSDGTVTALDIAPENIEVVNKRAQKSNWLSSVSAQVGTILDLQYEANHFDAVWCANTSQYLNNTEIKVMLEQFVRVVRPGGIVAIKEFDMTGLQIQPMPVTALIHLVEALCEAGHDYFCNLLRTSHLPKHMREAGLVDIQQKPMLMVRNQPLKAVERQLFYDVLQGFSEAARNLDLPKHELQSWAEIAELDSNNSILEHPDFQYRTIQTVFLGRVSGLSNRARKWFIGTLYDQG